MDLDVYQRGVVTCSHEDELRHELISMLGLGGYAGDLLLAHERFLREALSAGTSRGLVARELGRVLRCAAKLGAHHDLSLTQIASHNLVKVHHRAQALGLPGIKALPSPGATLNMGSYQDLAMETDQEVQVGFDPLSLSVPLLGLVGEVGSVLTEVKKRYRGDSLVADWKSFLLVELGDLLWYTAMVAQRLALPLDRVASDDLLRAQRARSGDFGVMTDARSLDRAFPVQERFPRQLHIRFQERLEAGVPKVTMVLLDVVPNAFPDGRIKRADGRIQGYAIDAPLGDEVDDNSRRSDEYRYHDAIHLGFLAGLGWSPTLRGLLKLKRKSSKEVDDAEDGARAVFAEEGLAAILAKQAPVFDHFASPKLVPDDLLDLIARVVEDLEVGELPFWRWREAISQGFAVMRKLADSRGGYVLANLDAQSLNYSKFPFSLDDEQEGCAEEEMK